jgi:hypothetical protein
MNSLFLYILSPVFLSPFLFPFALSLLSPLSSLLSPCPPLYPSLPSPTNSSLSLPSLLSLLSPAPLPLLTLLALLQVRAFTAITKDQLAKALCRAEGERQKMAPFLELVEETSLELCTVLDAALTTDSVCAAPVATKFIPHLV